MSKEVFFDYSEFIVSKTDTRGRIKYVNRTFIDISGYTEEELIGRPHSMIRHKKMPRSVFQLFWDTILDGKEMFAYVVNACKNGDYYWVLAYVTTDLDPRTGEIVGYHSVRRVPSRKAVAEIGAIYENLCNLEKKYPSKKDAIAAGLKALTDLLESVGTDYESWVYSLEDQAS